jgi:hypothetical protein
VVFQIFYINLNTLFSLFTAKQILFLLEVLLIILKMACCADDQKKERPQDIKAKQESKAVDRAIASQVQREALVNKLLLLGAGEFLLNYFYCVFLPFTPTLF